MDHEHLARAEKRYLSDHDFRVQVEEVVTVMMSSIERVNNDSIFLSRLFQQERQLVRMTACVALLMNEEKNG